MQQNCLRKEEHQQEVFGGKVTPEYTNDVISHYHIIYFEFLQCTINTIKDRFEQGHFIWQTQKSFGEGSQRRCICPEVQGCYGNIRQRLYWK